MSEAMALRAAIDLVHMPSRVRQLRSRPLPDGVLILLRVAAGDESAAECAAELTARSSALVREAAGFFIEQILLSPCADSYRVLGANPKATSRELRRNMILLLKCLHPDAQPKEERSVFAGRVILAWSDLKTPERRAAYDEARRTLMASGSSRFKTGERGWPVRHASFNLAGKRVRFGKLSSSARLLDRSRPKGRLRRALLILLGGPKS